MVNKKLIIDSHVGIGGNIEDRIKNILKNMDSLSIDKSIIWNIPRNPEQMGKNNDIIHQLVCTFPKYFIGFASVDPNAEKEAQRELLRSIRNLGLSGLKIHSNISKIAINNPSLLEIVKIAKDLDVPIVLHVDSPSFTKVSKQKTKWSDPSFIDSIVDIYDSPKVWCAHMGGIEQKNVQNSKISFQTTGCELETIENAVYTVGAERVIFGSDFPCFNPFEELDKVFKAKVTNTDKQKILSENVKNIIKLL
jgi:predicted TIM-barrel fold metal-dependent hydrolase